jgi:antitoxin ParD1/3/4
MSSNYGLGDHFEGFVQNLIDTGRYASASEVVRDGLRLMEAREQAKSLKLAVLRGLIEEGLESGSSEPVDIAAIKAEARRRWENAG